jgi:hypothetical protein
VRDARHLEAPCRGALRADGGIPTGLGRCEVCGFPAGNRLAAVLPTDWKGFSYEVGGQERTVYFNASQPFVELSLGASVPDQNVTIYERR